MVKINKLLEERIELAAYEKVFGELPQSLKKEPDFEVEEEDKESEESSSSEDLAESDYLIRGLGKVVDEPEEKPEAKSTTNFFDISLPPRMPLMSFGQSILGSRPA